MNENVRQIAGEFRGGSIALIGVSCDGNADRIRKFIREHNYQWPQVFVPGDTLGDENLGLSKAFLIDGIPAAFVVTPEGKIHRALTAKHAMEVVEQMRHAPTD